MAAGHRRLDYADVSDIVVLAQNIDVPVNLY